MDQKRSTNLCSTYILPLLDLNRYSFGDATNFVNSYVGNNDEFVIVRLVNPYRPALTHRSYRFCFSKEGHTYYVFEIDPKHKETVRYFREGKYSRFPEEAKSQIKRKSGLSYRIPTGTGGVKSAKELLALDKDKKLKEKLEQDLAVKLPADAELVSIPDEENFYELVVAKPSELVITQ